MERSGKLAFPKFQRVYAVGWPLSSVLMDKGRPSADGAKRERKKRRQHRYLFGFLSCFFCY